MYKVYFERVKNIFPRAGLIPTSLTENGSNLYGKAKVTDDGATMA